MGFRLSLSMDWKMLFVGSSLNLEYLGRAALTSSKYTKSRVTCSKFVVCQFIKFRDFIITGITHSLLKSL